MQSQALFVRPAPICGFDQEEEQMPGGQPRYIPFMRLVADWAQVSGMPPDMVLRRLCEWAIAGGFPEGAFVTSTGDKIPPLDLLTAFRARVGGGQATVGDWTIHMDPDTARHQLASALLRDHDVLKFCEHTDTLAPPSLLRGLKRLLASRGHGKHIAPPECLDADEHAAKQGAYHHAVGGLNMLRQNISGLNGEHTRFGPRRAKNAPVNFEYWGPKWTKMRDRVHEDIRRCGDQELQRDLEALEVEWKMFVAEQHSAQPEAAEARRGAAADAPPSEATTEAAASEASPIAAQRLRICKSKGQVRLDGHELILTQRSLRLLWVLTEAAVESTGPVPRRDLEKLVDGSGDKAVAQAVYILKQELIRGGVESDRVQTLIENIRAAGYRLTVSASDIHIED